MLGDIPRFRLFYALNSCALLSSSRTQKIISLSSCEAELRAIVSSASGGLYIRAVLEFALGGPLHFHIFIECTPTCDEERSRKSETFRWNVAMGSEQETFQDGTRTKR